MESDKKNIVSNLITYISFLFNFLEFKLHFFKLSSIVKQISYYCFQCRVLRNKEIIEVHHNYLHVGDIINVEYGMNIPVDGLVLQSTQLAADESAMTGESDECKKDIFYFCNMRRDEKLAENIKFDETNKAERAHMLPSPLLLSGTSIAGGEGKMVCVMVG